MPANIFLLALPFRVNYDPHSHFIEVIHFILVEDVELDCVVFEGVGHFKEEPLGIPVSVDIVLQQ